MTTVPAQSMESAASRSPIARTRIARPVLADRPRPPPGTLLNAPQEESDACRDVQRAVTHLVEARAAVHRSIVARCERDDRLPPAGSADRGVEFARSIGRSRTLGGRPARRASLRIVQQALAGVEGLLAGREDELLAAVATGQCPVLVHPLRFLLARIATRRSSTGPVGLGPPAGARHGGMRASFGDRAWPGTHVREDTRAVKGSARCFGVAIGLRGRQRVPDGTGTGSPAFWSTCLTCHAP